MPITCLMITIAHTRIYIYIYAHVCNCASIYIEREAMPFDIHYTGYLTNLPVPASYRSQWLELNCVGENGNKCAKGGFQSYTSCYSRASMQILMHHTSLGCMSMWFPLWEISANYSLYTQWWQQNTKILNLQLGTKILLGAIFKKEKRQDTNLCQALIPANDISQIKTQSWLWRGTRSVGRNAI